LPRRPASRCNGGWRDVRIGDLVDERDRPAVVEALPREVEHAGRDLEGRRDEAAAERRHLLVEVARATAEARRLGTGADFLGVEQEAVLTAAGAQLLAAVEGELRERRPRDAEVGRPQPQRPAAAVAPHEEAVVGSGVVVEVRPEPRERAEAGVAGADREDAQVLGAEAERLAVDAQAEPVEVEEGAIVVRKRARALDVHEPRLVVALIAAVALEEIEVPRRRVALVGHELVLVAPRRRVAVLPAVARKVHGRAGCHRSAPLLRRRGRGERDQDRERSNAGAFHRCTSRGRRRGSWCSRAGRCAPRAA
jgi:hypothetical protein